MSAPAMDTVGGISRLVPAAAGRQYTRLLLTLPSGMGQHERVAAAPVALRDGAAVIALPLEAVESTLLEQAEFDNFTGDVGIHSPAVASCHLRNRQRADIDILLVEFSDLFLQGRLVRAPPRPPQH